ncbi:hypothetical protein V1527DRAFT_522125 [Lipomyces starkeyi]
MSSGALGRFFANPRSVLVFLMIFGHMQSVNAYNGVLCATLIYPIAYNQEGRPVFTGYNPITGVWFNTGKPECSCTMVNFGGDGQITPPLIVDCVHYGRTSPMASSGRQFGSLSYVMYDGGTCGTFVDYS